MALTADCPRCGSALPAPGGRCPVCATSAGNEPIIFAGHYRIEKLLGRGGQGTVHLARDLTLDRLCAIKVLKPGLTSHAELVARFRREGRLLARLDHPNVVPVYGIGREGDQPYIVMKHLEGATLSKLHRQRSERWTVAEFTPLLRQICAGLGHMHALGFVHRDLKPGNLFVSPEGHLTILDLGIARDSESKLTKPGMAIGTASYMSPEHTGVAQIDARSDLYSLGIIIFEALTGGLPFTTASDVEMMRAHRMAPVPNPVALGVPAEIARVVVRALAKKPEERFSTAAELFSAWMTAAGSSAFASLEADELTEVSHGPAPMRTLPDPQTTPGGAPITSSQRGPSSLASPAQPMMLGAEDPVVATTAINSPHVPHPAEEDTTGQVRPELIAAVKAGLLASPAPPVLHPKKPTMATPVPSAWASVENSVVVQKATPMAPVPAPSVAAPAAAVAAEAAPPAAAKVATPPKQRVRLGLILAIVAPLAVAVLAMLVHLSFDLEGLRDRLWTRGATKKVAAAHPSTEVDAGVAAPGE